MRWFKIAAILGGIIIAFLIVGSVVHFILAAITTIVIAALVVGGVAIAIKMARSRKQVSRKREEKQVREPDYSEYARPLPRADIELVSPPPGRQSGQDIDEELARLKREMGS
jgi:membrane protein involved in colicin uptake